MSLGLGTLFCLAHRVCYGLKIHLSVAPKFWKNEPLCFGSPTHCLTSVSGQGFGERGKWLAQRDIYGSEENAYKLAVAAPSPHASAEPALLVIQPHTTEWLALLFQDHDRLQSEWENTIGKGETCLHRWPVTLKVGYWGGSVSGMGYSGSTADPFPLTCWSVTRFLLLQWFFRWAMKNIWQFGGHRTPH